MNTASTPLTVAATPSASKALLARLSYTLTWWLALPIVLLRLVWRARKQPGYLHHVRERLGFCQLPASAPLIWIHAVSVGETRAAQSLVQALLQAYPDHQILLTHTTPTGRETGRQLMGGQVMQCYLPWDIPPFVNAFLAHWKPRLGILMETEMWPNLVHACQRERIPLMLANARLSEKSARGYLKFSALTQPAFAKLAAIAAQTEADANRLANCGAKNITTLGNLKFDTAPPATREALSHPLRQLIGARPVVLLASTRDGEEEMLVEAWLAQADRPANALLVVVPRHPQRFANVEKMLIGKNLRVQKRSTLNPNTPCEMETQCVLGDSMGEMFQYYALADVAIIGGSWQPLGGQNLIEACAVGTPCIIGPHTFNFAAVSEQAVTTGAALRATQPFAACQQACALLKDEAERLRIAHQATQFAQQHRGATERTLHVIQSLLQQH